MDHAGVDTLASVNRRIGEWEAGRKVPDQYDRHLIAAALGITLADLGLAANSDFVWRGRATPS